MRVYTHTTDRNLNRKETEFQTIHRKYKQKKKIIILYHNNIIILLYHYIPSLGSAEYVPVYDCTNKNINKKFFMIAFKY